MIRIFKLVLLLVVSQVAFGQAPSNYTNINGRYRWIAGMFDSTFHIPKGTSPSLRTGGSTNAGGLFYNTSDSSVYTYTGTQWIKVRGSINPSDTTNKYVTQVYKKNGSDSVFYVKGGIHTWAFNDSTGSAGGGGGGKVYYFNGGVNMGTFGGLTMYELGDTANTGAAANFTRATTGAIANFITDPNKPGLLQIPAGSWTIDAWLSETGGGANHAEIWIEVEKWDGSTITTIATSPIEQITEGSTPNLYSWSVSIPTTSLTVTDRIIIQFYISNTNGKTVTLYTQNGYVGEVHTTFTTGIGAINGLTAAAQYLVTGSSGTDFNISSVTATHTFNLPTASATNRGALSSADWTTFNSKLSPADTVSLSNRINLKLNISDTAAMLSPYARTNAVNAGLALKVNISDTSSMLSPYARKNFLNAGTGISYSSTTGTIANTAPDQTVALNAGTGISISGTYPNFTITNSSPSSGGTVTSVGSNNGTGLTGGPITTSGTLAIDTLLVSTRAWRQKGIDSVQANLTAGLALKVNISDTASMLSPYLRSNTAAATYVPQTRTITINGTSQDLTADRTWNVGTVTTAAATGGGQVAFFNGSTVLTSISTLYFDGVNKLAIGNSSPDSMLSVTQGAHIQRGVRLSGLPTAPGTKSLRIDANGSLSVSDTLTNGISGTGTTNYIPKFTSSSAIGNSNLQTDASGNLGLGVTPSAWESVFNVFQIGNTGVLANNTSDLRTILNSNAFNNTSGTTTYLANGFATSYMQISGTHRWYNAPSGTAGNAISFTQAMTLDASGNLGLGITNPSAKLHISGTNSQVTSAIYQTIESTDSDVGMLIKSFSTAYYPFIRFNQGSTGKFEQGVTGSGDASGGGNYYFNFTTASGATGSALFLKSNGNVGIGTTNPSGQLHIKGASGLTNFGTQMLQVESSTDNYSGIVFSGTSGSNAAIRSEGASTMTFWTASGTSYTERMRITSGGNVGIGTTTIGSTLQVNGNAAIGYSASTAAPTNGLAVAGNVGINTTTPNSTLDVAGSVAAAIAIKTATYTLTSSDYTVVFDLNGNATANLPDATTCKGRIYVIKINRTNVSDVLTIDPNGAQTIDGNATYDLQCQQAITIQSDGSNWRIIGDFLGGLNCL